MELPQHIHVTNEGVGASSASLLTTHKTGRSGQYCPSDTPTIQKGPNKLERWTAKNPLEFNKAKYSILHLGRNNVISQHRLG